MLATSSIVDLPLRLEEPRLRFEAASSSTRANWFTGLRAQATTTSETNFRSKEGTKMGGSTSPSRSKTPRMPFLLRSVKLSSQSKIWANNRALSVPPGPEGMTWSVHPAASEAPVARRRLQ